MISEITTFLFLIPLLLLLLLLLILLLTHLIPCNHPLNLPHRSSQPGPLLIHLTKGKNYNHHQQPTFLKRIFQTPVVRLRTFTFLAKLIVIVESKRHICEGEKRKG